MVQKIEYEDGKPCWHKGCLDHIKIPCEGCGRYGGHNEKPLRYAPVPEPTPVAQVPLAPTHVTPPKAESAIRLLAICTSFRRPEMLKNMLQSFRATKSPGTDIFIYLHDDDPFLNEYQAFIDGWPHVVGPHKFLQRVVNDTVFEYRPETPYYQFICDDHIYHTIGWDALLIDAIKTKANDWGFCCGRDLANNDNWELNKHPSAEIWSWKMAKTLGYIYARGFEHHGIDFYSKDLGLAIDALTFVPEVVIEHLWYGGCGKPGDQNIIDHYKGPVMEKAQQVFLDWQKNEKQIAIDKIRAVQKEEANARHT